MNVHIFGATSPPSCAIFGLQQLAKDHLDEHPKAASFIQDNFYVDDGLISLATPSDAIDMINDAKALCSKGNLVLHKFLTNHTEVAATFGWMRWTKGNYERPFEGQAYAQSAWTKPGRR